MRHLIGYCLLTASFISVVVNLHIHSRLVHQSDNRLISEESILVEVVGAVKSPGLYRLARHSSVADLLNVAGGITAAADAVSTLSGLNLTAPLTNYQKITIAANNSQNHARQPNQGAKLNVNTATQKQIEELPGIGATLAKRLIDARPVRGEEDLANLSGFTTTLLAKIRDYITY